MDVLVERCGGLDVHKDVVVAHVRFRGPDGERLSVSATFRTFTEELLALRDWLVAHGVTRVGMEATGVYWKPVFYILEEAVECWLLNARHMRNVPGRKTDMADAEWICQLIEHGLVRPSFVPPPAIRELRELTRYRKTRIEERTREGQRLDKVLQDAGVKLSSVASDVLGKSSRAMLEALVGGSRDADALADLARGRLRRKLPDLKAALTSRFAAHHAVLISEILAHLDYLDESIERLSAEVDRVISPFARQRDLLMTIPGVDQRVAEAIIAEIGVDMSRFPSAAHLASWAGMCPGQHESAGKSRKGTARPGDGWLQRHLTIAAMAASRTKGTYLAAQYHHLLLGPRKTGKKRARKAVGHTILVAVWHILANDVPWNELGDDYYRRRQSPEHQARRKLADLRKIGWTIHHNDDGTATIIPPAAA